MRRSGASFVTGADNPPPSPARRLNHL